MREGLLKLQDFHDLAPLDERLNVLLAGLNPIAPRRLPLAEAIGRVLADDASAAQAFPAKATALRDGYAVQAAQTVGASPYSPVSISGRIEPVRAGEALPEECDAILPPAAAVATATGADLFEAVAPGTDVLDRGEDLSEGSLIVKAGQRLRPHQAAVLMLAGHEAVSVRIPTLAVEGDGPVASMIDRLACEAGAGRSTPEAADIVVTLCEPGYAGTEGAAGQLAKEGTLLVHGLALRPGEAIGFGVRPRPGGGESVVLVVPRRLDEAVAAWLLLIKPIFSTLAGLRAQEPGETLPLVRKIVSAPGMADLVVLRRLGGPTPSFEPAATGALPWSALATAEAYYLIPPESEGVPAGTRISGKPL